MYLEIKQVKMAAAHREGESGMSATLGRERT
jgi:hypothetical protein